MDQGIREANYVLMICTETYLRRLQLEEEQGKGLGVAWEGSLIYNTLYRNRTLNQKFIPVIFAPSDSAFIPTILFGNNHYDLSQPRGYDHVYRHIRGELGAEKPPLGQPHFTRTIYSNSLPTVEGDLFGRKDELTLLDQAWANPQTHVVQFIASGGTGKTKLLKHWLDSNTDSIEALLAWSFYSQGSSEDKQVSATPFFTHAFAILQSDKTSFVTEEEKGEHLAHLLRQRRCLLVLDGLEPLQHAGRGMRGELKDHAIRQLLKSLAGEYNSLCIITTRLAVHELSDRQAHVISHDLQDLAPADGVSLLKSWQVHGSNKELDKAVHEYGCHALALHLLGNALHSYLNGDVRKRDTLDELMGDYDDVERHAFKVMQAYQRWLVDEAGKPTAELQLLYLLGLFDHPIDTEVLEVLWQEQIPALTAGIPLKAWKIAIRDLREKHRLLSEHEGHPNLLDCHPLIREYFGGQLKTQQSESWQQAHEHLYKYYKALPKKGFPDTLEEIQPLLSAVAHGCAANLHQEVIEHVYWPRLQRGDAYIVKVHGLVMDDLALVRYFFDKPWSKPTSNLSDYYQAAALNWAGFRLVSCTRFHEAIDAFAAARNTSISQKVWGGVSIDSNHLAHIKLVLGLISEAITISKESVNYALQSKEADFISISYSVLGESLHQAGYFQEALDTFFTSELNWGSPRLTSILGYRYSRLLLECGHVDDVILRSHNILLNANLQQSLLDKGLAELLLGMIFTAKNDPKSASQLLNASVNTLRKTNQQDFLPNSFLVRAALHRKTSDFALARRDLQEVFDIAEPSGMRLHLTDYHLEMARLLLAEENPPYSPFCKGGDHPTDTPETDRRVLPFEKGETEGIYPEQPELSFADHVNAAAKLITETGYHRRDKELEELQKHLVRQHPVP